MINILKYIQMNYLTESKQFLFEYPLQLILTRRERTACVRSLSRSLSLRDRDRVFFLKFGY